MSVLQDLVVLELAVLRPEQVWCGAGELRPQRLRW